MPSGSMTMLELAKTLDNPRHSGILQTYALSSHVMMTAPVQEAPSGMYSWDVEDDLPYTAAASGTRAINGSWTASRAEVSAFSSNVKIYGGELQIDNFLKRINPQRVEFERRSQIAARARLFTADFFEGAGGNNLRGIRDWLVNETFFASQTFDVGTASQGYRLMTDHLDQLLNLVNVVPGRTYIYCTNTVSRRIRKLSRGNSATGDIGFANRFTPEEWGMFAGVYDNVPVIAVKDGKNADLLNTTRGGGSSSTIYAITYGEEDVTLFQAGMPVVRDLTQADVYEYQDYEWYIGLAPQNLRSIARGRYVLDSI